MSTTKELQTRNEDLLLALKAVGELLANGAVPAKKRIDMALGILFRYDAAPQGRTGA